MQKYERCFPQNDENGVSQLEHFGQSEEISPKGGGRIERVSVGTKEIIQTTAHYAAALFGQSQSVGHAPDTNGSVEAVFSGEDVVEVGPRAQEPADGESGEEEVPEGEGLAKVEGLSVLHPPLPHEDHEPVEAGGVDAQSPVVPQPAPTLVRVELLEPVGRVGRVRHEGPLHVLLVHQE